MEKIVFFQIAEDRKEIGESLYAHLNLNENDYDRTNRTFTYLRTYIGNKYGIKFDEEEYKYENSYVYRFKKRIGHECDVELEFSCSLFNEDIINVKTSFEYVS